MVTILSKLALLIPFYYAVRKHVGVLPWVSCVWQLAVAASRVGVMWLLRSLSWLLRIPLGGGVYLAMRALVGGIRQPDMDLLGRPVPLRRLRARIPRTPSQG